eukprot:9470197-Pyramimonas_sp.AAC.1
MVLGLDALLHGRGGDWTRTQTADAGPEKFNLGGEQLNEYLQRWSWPAAYASVRKICKGNEDCRPGGSAPEFLSLAPVLAKYLTDVVLPSGRLPNHVDSGVKLCKVVELLQLVNSGG